MIFQLKAERNYHIFYQILSNKKPELLGESDLMPLLAPTVLPSPVAHTHSPCLHGFLFLPHFGLTCIFSGLPIPLSHILLSLTSFLSTLSFSYFFSPPLLVFYFSLFASPFSCLTPPPSVLPSLAPLLSHFFWSLSLVLADSPLLFLLSPLLLTLPHPFPYYAPLPTPSALSWPSAYLPFLCPAPCLE